MKSDNGSETREPADDLCYPLAPTLKSNKSEKNDIWVERLFNQLLDRFAERELQCYYKL